MLLGRKALRKGARDIVTLDVLRIVVYTRKGFKVCAPRGSGMLAMHEPTNKQEHLSWSF
jgi:hypothetical protein